MARSKPHSAPKTPRLSVSVTLLEDPDYRSLILHQTDGGMAFGCFISLCVYCKMARNEGRIRISKRVLSSLIGFTEPQIDHTISVIKTACAENDSEPWLYETKKREIVIRQFSKWNNNGWGGNRPAAGRKSSGNQDGIKMESSGNQDAQLDSNLIKQDGIKINQVLIKNGVSDSDSDSDSKVFSNTAPGEIPSCIDTPAFGEAWREWQAYRRQKKAKLTPIGARKQLAHLAELGEARAIATIEHTILKGWQGLVEPPKGGDDPEDEGSAVLDYRDPTDAEAEQLFAELRGGG